MNTAAFLEGIVVKGVAAAAIICAAGSSVRMAGSGGGTKKEYLPLPGNARDEFGDSLTVLGASVRAFAALPEVKTIVVTVPDDPATGEAAARNAISPALIESMDAHLHFVKGGKTRRASVLNALSALLEMFPSKPDAHNYALIHDGARPWVAPSLIRRVILEAKNHSAAIPLLPLTETPKETTVTMDMDGSFGGGPVYVKTHLKRAFVGMAQTPQAFAFPDILELHRLAAERERETGIEFTDDAEIWGAFRGSVAVIPGDPQNRKITFPEDMA